MSRTITPPKSHERVAARQALDFKPDAFLAMFVGSAYGPNVEAANFLIGELAPRLPGVVFVVAGGVGSALPPCSRENVRITGFLDEPTKLLLLRACDIAVNPMFSGSGTNIKMFDFMAAGLPVVSTAIGARGICCTDHTTVCVVGPNAEAFCAAIQSLASSPAEVELRGTGVRQCVERHYSFEAISPGLGRLLKKQFDRRLSRFSSQHRRLAMLTTWNVKCGIAEHARYLAEALEQSGVELTILGNSLNAETPASLDAEMQFAVVRVWHWDNKRWTDSSIDLAKVRQALTELPSRLLLIQHHTGFLASGAYLKVANLAAELGYAVIVEAHNVRDWDDGDVANWLRIPGVAFIVHSEDEHDRLRHAAFKDAVLIPLGVRTARASSKTRSSVSGDHERSATPLIGGFGFLRPHKGVKRAIQIIAELRTAFPNIRYEGYHALYPGNESETYLEECLAEAERLGVKDNIYLDTQFHEVDDLVNRLSESDCVLLPYLQSSEGASASANVALASGCPIVTSPSAIFYPLRSTVHMVSEDTIDAYVTAVKAIVSDPVYAADLASRSQQWVEQHSYEGAAQRLLEIAERMLGPVTTSAC